MPSGVTRLSVTAIGGKGGEGSDTSVAGFGAGVSGVLRVTPGSTLYVEVGAVGCLDCTEVFGGGGAATAGAGGGASDVRTEPMIDGKPSLESRLLVAGGGGGGAYEGDDKNSPVGAGPGGQAGVSQNGEGEGGHTGGQASRTVFGGEGGKGATVSGPGQGGKGGAGTEHGEAGSEGMLGGGGAGGSQGGSAGGGGGGGGYFGAGGGGAGGAFAANDEFAGGGGGGAGASYTAPSVLEPIVRTAADETPAVTITPTTSPPPACTTATGQGVYKKVGEAGRLKLEDSLSTELEAPQVLHVRYESGKVHFRLIKLEGATCSGEPGERDFQGEGAAAKGKETGYTLSFSIYEKAGGFFFESKLMKGAEVVEASGGPLKKSTEVITE